VKRDHSRDPLQSPYDGHDDYRAQFAPPTVGALARRFVHGLLAIALGLVVLRLAFNLLHPGRNVLLLFTGGLAVILAIAAAALAHRWLTKPRPEGSSLWLREGIVAIVFVVGFLLPVRQNAVERDDQDERQRVQRETAEAEHERRQEERLEAGMQAMRASNRFAPPGVAPPDFEVVDDGATVRVTYHGTESSSISLARVMEDATQPGGWRGCALWTAGKIGGGRYYSHFVESGMTLTFNMYDDCIAEFRDAPLEFRVGHPELGGERGARAWWSESAFARPEGREWEYWQRKRQPQ
jgi:hypothetical protein